MVENKGQGVNSTRRSGVNSGNKFVVTVKESEVKVKGSTTKVRLSTVQVRRAAVRIRMSAVEVSGSAKVIESAVKIVTSEYQVKQIYVTKLNLISVPHTTPHLLCPLSLVFFVLFKLQQHTFSFFFSSIIHSFF